MGSMNAMGHVLVATASGVDELWDLLDELAERYRPGTGVTVHSLPPGKPRYCVHPTSDQQIEFRADDLFDALREGAIWLAGQIDLRDDSALWRRD